MTETRAPCRRIDRLGNPRPLIVTPAMLDRVEHRPDRSLTTNTNNAGNPTHFFSATKRHKRHTNKFLLLFCAFCAFCGKTKSRTGGARGESRARGTWRA